MGKFMIKSTATGLKFDLKAANGETIAVSQVYNTLQACLSGVASVRKNAPNAALEDQTEPGWKQARHPKFQLYLDRSGEYRFRLKAANVQIIAVSEGYRTRSGCLSGLESVRRNALEAAVEGP